MNLLQLNTGSSSFFNLARILAAQAVVFGHLTSWIHIWPKTMPPYMPYFQCLGVVVFFVLSGFLIPYSTIIKLKQNPDYSFREFFVERFARIYVSLIPCLLFILGIDLLQMAISSVPYGFADAFDVKTFFANIFMLEDAPKIIQNNLINVTTFGSARPLWTLAIEWWIYFWFGYLFLVIYTRRKTGILQILVMIVFSVVPYYNFIEGKGGGLMLPWFMGIVLLVTWPYLLRFSKQKFFTAIVCGFLIYMLFLEYRRTFFEYVDPYFVIILTLLMALLLVQFHEMKLPPLANKILQTGADFSFTLYLVHYSIMDLMVNTIGDKLPKIPFFIITFLTVNIIAYLIARYTEMKYKTFRSFLKSRFVKPAIA